MTYTVRFAHMKEASKWKVGDSIKQGDVIGIMGNTGQCASSSNGDGSHLHIDCVVGEIKTPYKLADIGKRFAPSEKQLDYFIDSDLFCCRPIVTTQFMDKEYKKQFDKDHPAIDVVTSDPLKKYIHWNRSIPGKVELVVYQPESYGNCIYISFDA